MCMTDVNRKSDDLIQELKDIDRVVIGEGEGAFTEFIVEGGIVRTWTLHRDEYGHCMLAFLAEGAVFPPHEHRISCESIVMARGSIDIRFEDENGEERMRSMKRGRPAFLEMGQNHRVYAREDSWVYTTMIPPDEGLK